MPNPQRIMVYGVCGSGKTTFAHRVAELINLPFHELDQVTWEPGWIVVPIEEQRRRVQAVCDQDEWVIDTAYNSWLDIPMGRVELMVCLDYPRWLSLGRLLWRSTSRAIDKRPVCNGNTESWRNFFSRDSIIVWHFRSFPRKRARMRIWASDPNSPKTVLLKSPKEAERWLQSLRTVSQPK